MELKFDDEYKNKYKIGLKNKFGYDEEFARNITVMVESLINYFGEEYTNLICDAVNSCKIRVLKNENGIRQRVADILKEEKMLFNFDPNEMQKLDRGFFSSPKIISENGSFICRSVKKIIVLPSHFNAENPDSLSILAKECIKLIKSELNSYTIEGNILTTKMGLTVTKERLATSEKGVTRELIETKGQGLSAGCTTYETLSLIRSEYFSDFDIYGNDNERLIAGILMNGDIFQLKDIIIKAEMLHDYSELIEAIAQRSNISYDDWIRMTDELHHLDNERIKANGTPDADGNKARNQVDRCFANIATQVRLSGAALTEYQDGITI